MPSASIEQVLEGIQTLKDTFKDHYTPGEIINLPKLCMSTVPFSRGGDDPIVYRDCFQKVLTKAVHGLHAPGVNFDDTRSIFVYGPKGDANAFSSFTFISHSVVWCAL